MIGGNETIIKTSAEKTIQQVSMHAEVLPKT